MKAIITIKRKGLEYLRSLERGGQTVIKDKSVPRDRAMGIVREHSGGELPEDLDFGDAACHWEWKADDELEMA